MPEYQVLSRLGMQQMIYAILSDEQIIRLEQEGESTFFYPVPIIRLAGLNVGARWVVHVFLSRDDMRADFIIGPSGL